MQANGFRIFLASPGGLDEYRRAARDQFEQIRLKIASPRGIEFDPIGWEDIPPSFGRPQSVINPKLDECNVLIGILGKQLGTPTGEAASGFVEEYERMVGRVEEHGDVQICIYMLRLTPEDLADPGDRLKAVLAFRERLFKEALVKEFRNVYDFAGQLYRDLVSLVLDADQRGRERAPVASPAEEEARATPEGEPSEKAGNQLRKLLSEAAERAPIPPERFRDDRFPLARLALWLSTWESWYFTNETFGVHQLNQVYAMRADAALSSVERRHVLRTMCANRSVAPGWALLGYDAAHAAPELLAIASTDDKEAARIGAFEMLGSEPIDAWLAREDVSVDRTRIFDVLMKQVDGLGDTVRNAMIDFAARIGGTDAETFLTELASRDATKQPAFAGLIRMYAAQRSATVYGLAATADAELDSETIAAVGGAAADADIEDLERLTTARDERLRILAIDLLAARGSRAVPTLMAKLDDAEDEVAAAAFRALSGVEDPQIDIAAAYATLAGREGLKFNDDLRRAFDDRLGVEVLRESIDWLDIRSASAYQVLAEKHWGEFRDTVRRDLGDHFKTFADESRVRYTKRLGVDVMESLQAQSPKLATVSASGVTQKVDPETAKSIRDFLAGSEWNERRFAVAALEGIVQNGEVEDAALVRDWLNSNYREVREAAARALVRIGTQDDVGNVLRLSEVDGGVEFAHVALLLSPGTSGAALKLLESPNAKAALAGARHLYALDCKLSDETLEKLLRATIDDVRRIGVACAVARDDDDELKSLLDRYTGSGRYFYNVVCLLDRALFAPRYLRERTRAELAEFAANDPSGPGALSRAARSMAAQMLRSRRQAER